MTAGVGQDSQQPGQAAEPPAPAAEHVVSARLPRAPRPWAPARLLSSAKEHWDRSRTARDAMVDGVAHSGRVIFAAGAVMRAVFFTFALSGPLPPEEMGIILDIPVLLDGGWL